MGWNSFWISIFLKARISVFFINILYLVLWVCNHPFLFLDCFYYQLTYLGDDFLQQCEVVFPVYCLWDFSLCILFMISLQHKRLPFWATRWNGVCSSVYNGINGFLSRAFSIINLYTAWWLFFAARSRGLVRYILKFILPCLVLFGFF